MHWKALFCKTSLAFLMLAGCDVGASGLTENWAARFETIVGGGYDSNVFGERLDEVSDGYATLFQTVSLSRVNSLTALELVGSAAQTVFFSESEADFLDSEVELRVSYPQEVVGVTHWNARTYWKDESQVDLDAGRRIQVRSSGALVAGEWLFSPKVGITGSIHGRVADRSRDGYSTTKSLRLRTGLSHGWRPEGRWSAEYGLTFSESDAGAGTDALHHIFGFRSSGTVSAKVKGDAFVGIRSSSFSGVYDFSDTGPIVSADLTWNASPRLKVNVGMLNDYDFAANGVAALRTSATLRLKRDLGRGLLLEARIGRGRAAFESLAGAEVRNDEYWDIGGHIEYSFTQRYFLRFSADWVDSDSSVDGRDVGRSVVSVRSGWRY